MRNHHLARVSNFSSLCLSLLDSWNCQSLPPEAKEVMFLFLPLRSCINDLDKVVVVEEVKGILGDPVSMLVGIIWIRLTGTGRSILNVGKDSSLGLPS